jgi:hypothetical protein
MKIGYYVQGSMDEAFVWGLAKRWCPDAGLAEGKFRGSSKESFWREIRKALLDLRDDKHCDILVVLTDADGNPWREVRRREASRVPETCQHLCVFGVADRNIECWLASDRGQMARYLTCAVEDIPTEDPSGFLQGKFGASERDEMRREAKERVRDFVAVVNMKPWINNSESFADFYDESRRLATQRNCAIPNERDA